MGKLGKLLQKGFDIGRGKRSSEDRAKDLAAAEAEKETTPLMPDVDELKRARRKKAASRKGGRASTILTGPSDTLGG